ncbi:hypothetical protein SAMN04488032_103255 [Pacificibacter marinus]|nr:hypothetical protein SAMN04488032_103255 [Pacificibacter marinus]
MFGWVVLLPGLLAPFFSFVAVCVVSAAFFVWTLGWRSLAGWLFWVWIVPVFLVSVWGCVFVVLVSCLRCGVSVVAGISLCAGVACLFFAFVCGLGGVGEDGVPPALAVVHPAVASTLFLCGCRRLGLMSCVTVLVCASFFGDFASCRRDLGFLLLFFLGAVFLFLGRFYARGTRWFFLLYGG